MEENKVYKLPLEFVKRIKDTILKKSSLEGELKHTSIDGKERWFQNTIMPILDDDGCQIGEVIVRYDVTQKKVLEKLSITDGLTKLYNKRYFDNVFYREVNRLNREKAMLSFMILDVDYFKDYNDSKGHKAGDEALIQISQSISKSLNRGSDFAFRLGGEEFGILFSGIDKEKSLSFAKNIKANIEALNISHPNSKISNHITISIGLIVVDFSDKRIDESSIYTMADTALYEAKGSGRNKVCLYKN